MAKEIRATDSTTPKKRTRKPMIEAEATTKVPKTSKSASKPTVISEIAEVAPVATLEERVRVRAYELYVQRGGTSGSPEQDWFQAVAEIRGRSVA